MLAKNKEHSARSKGDRRLCFERAERLAKQDARARIAWAKRVYGRMCRAADWEPRARYRGAASRGYRGGIPPVLLFFCRRFLFQIKRKCRNAESVKSLIIVGREGSKPIINNLQLLWPCIAMPISDSREGCPYKLHSNKIVQISRADNTRPKQLCRFIILQ